MALQPRTTACLTDNASKMIITETRGAYHAVNNTTGWGTPNMQGNQVTAATILIEFPDGTTTSTNVLSQIPATVTSDIEFNAIEDDYPDGIYTITITLAGTENVSNTVRKLFTCTAQCCVDKMWAKIPEKFYDLSDEELLKYIDQCSLAEGLLKGINSAGGCLKEDIVENVLERVNRICSFESCNCD